jgi:hypothetical protein
MEWSAVGAGEMMRHLMQIVEAAQVVFSPDQIISKLTECAQPGITLVDPESIGYGDDPDAYLYHVTTVPNAQAILQHGFRANQRRMFSNYGHNSRGRVFFTERGGARFWVDRVEEHLVHDYDDPPEVTVLRVPRDSLGELHPDAEGTRDAHYPAYYITPGATLNEIRIADMDRGLVPSWDPDHASNDAWYDERLRDYTGEKPLAWKIRDAIPYFERGGVTVLGPQVINPENTFLFRSGDTLVGFLKLYHHTYRRGGKASPPRDTYLIKDVFIKPEYRKSGAITALYDYLLTQKGIALEADSVQTQGSRNVWRRLFRAGHRIEIVQADGTVIVAKREEDLDRAYSEDTAFLVASK